MVDEVIVPAMKMDAKYETYLLGTAFARPVIGKKLAEIAIAEGADATRTARPARATIRSGSSWPSSASPQI